MKTKLTQVTYLGFTATDRRLSDAMLPWLIREIRATGTNDKLSLSIEDGCVKAYDGNFEPVLVHRLVDILRSPSPEPIYSGDGKRLNTREYRTRRRLEEERHRLVARMNTINPEFKPPPDYKPPAVRVADKVMIPQEQHPDINFVGLLIGPRGNTLKAMEKETGAKIIIRGKGSVKEGKVGRKDGQPLPGEDEPLHAYITALQADAVKKAADKVREVIRQGVEVPEGQNDLRRMQLRELAQLNGTLRDGDQRCANCGGDHRAWLCPDKPNVTASVVCAACGGAGHVARDCRHKRPGQTQPAPDARIDHEYMSLMAELGEAPPPPPGAAAAPPPRRHHQPSLFSGGGGGQPRALMAGGVFDAPPPVAPWLGAPQPPPPGAPPPTSRKYVGGGAHCKASHVPECPDELFYVVFNEKEALLQCYLFRTHAAHEVSELFTQMREPSPGAPSPRGSSASLGGSVMRNVSFQQTNSSEHLPWTSPAVPSSCNTTLTNEGPPPLLRSISNASALTSLCADLSPSDSHFFEVLYIGKVRISQRKVPESLIDDALTKFAQHEVEKARQARRHSLLSSTGSSIYSNESSESINAKKPECNTKLNITPSTTPLEPDKNTPWRSENNLPQRDNILEQRYNKNDAVDKEFDMFSKERLDKPVKKSHIPLEPKVLILNAPKNNLGTVNEDHEHEEISSIISETASSITQFCQNNFLTEHTTKDGKENKNNDVQKDTNKTEKENNNPFFNDMKENEKQDNAQKFLVDNLATKTVLEVTDATKVAQQKLFDINEKKPREDSPAPINFDEITRKPRLSVSNKQSNDPIERRSSPMPENRPFLRDRSASIGTISSKTPISQFIGEQNRTMLFQVGRSELRLISPDRKQILLHRAFKDVASCVLGRTNKEHFGFVCRENSTDAYACYVFKCESDSVATEVINAIKQAFVAHAELLKRSREKSPDLTCEHCPVLWYHRLCHDIEGMNDKKSHAFILRRIEQLPEDEQDTIITKYQGGTNHMYEVNEHNSFLMMLLRAHCEAKQLRHVHDTAENRSEFLNQYLGGSTIFMKAKRSLSSGFDHLLKRRSSKDDINVTLHIKKEPSPVPPTIPMVVPDGESNPELLAPDGSRSKSVSPTGHGSGDPPPSPAIASTVDEDRDDDLKDEATTPLNSPMMDIFLKVSDNRPSVSSPGVEPDSTWRQAIYEKVLQPTDSQDGDVTQSSLLRAAPPAGKRTRDQLRQLWKMAIDQTILLVRMEKENARLRENEESSAVRRIKLEYNDLGACDPGVTLMWDSLLHARDPSQPAAKVDRHMLTQAVMQGVPRVSRGAVWYFLAEQHSLRSAPPDTKTFPLYHHSYRALIAGLTKHQHAILIDLGRTFPKHSYFASALGPGQLALYNILKAYSLLDPDVGYCQGLSFVAGVLLLHMEEADAFVLLRHLMFRRGLRKQYLPDMQALQVQLYQLSRLLRDHEPDLHAKLEALDISPALYAAPWMLTLFTSQFPLGFVVRVFDLIFLESLDVMFSFSLALLSVHKDGLMLCESCEEAAEYLKHKLPDMTKGIYDKVMKKVHTLDINRQLSDYAVEYAVLREEMPRMAALSDQNKRLMEDKQRMGGELDNAMDAMNNYQKIQSRLEFNNKHLEQQLTLLSRYVSSHHKQEMPVEIKKIVQNYNKRISFSSKILKFTSNDDEDPRKNLKTLASAPNLFAKISKEDVLNAANKEKTVKSIENDRKQFMMKKSQSVHSGLIANRQYPMKIDEEIPEKDNNDSRIDNARTDSFRTDSGRTDSVKTDSSRTESLKESLRELGKKQSGFSANTHERIRQERLFEKQLKNHFDENLKKLDEKLQPKSYLDDLSIFQSRKSMSLNLRHYDQKNDSGFSTPVTPTPKDNLDKKSDSCTTISHPLSDCDADIKFDCQSTALKQIRPLKNCAVDNKNS